MAGWSPRLRRPGPAARNLLGFGSYVTASGLLWLIYSQADQAIAAKVVGPVALGYYGLAFQIISMPTSRLAAGFGQVAYPVFCRMQTEPERIRDWYLRLLAVLGALGLPVFVGLGLVAWDGVALGLGPKWLPAVSSLQLLCLPGYFLFLNCTLYPVFNALNRPDLAARYNAAYALIMPLAFLLLGNTYGLAGICTAWMILYPLIGGTMVALSRPVLGFGVREMACTQASAWASVAVMAVVVMSVQASLPGADRAPRAWPSRSPRVPLLTRSPSGPWPDGRCSRTCV